jgi:protein-S-isoprenylcysteine O-methyltransferase Ste14
MKKLETKAIGGLLNLLVCLGLMIFLPAWTLRYWQAWIFLFVFFTSSLAITLYLMKNDPELLERRVKGGATAEKEMSQKVIQAFAGIAFFATVVLPALDHRLGWSVVPTYAVLIGDLFVAMGFLAVFLVFKENTYTSGIVEVAADQKVVSTGPYALVRHPMYSGALVMLLGIPPALGSWWGLFAMVPMTLVIVWRLVAEERFLARMLPGYEEYQKKVSYRLAPFVW